MRCSGCGTEAPEGNRYCASCGAPLGHETVRMPVIPPVSPPTSDEQPTIAFAQPPVTPAPPANAPTPPASAGAPPPYPPAAIPSHAAPVQKAGGRRGLLIAVIVMLSVIIAGGAVAGIYIWRTSASKGPAAEVESVELQRADGRDLDLDRVPLDTGLTLIVRYRAEYGEGGKGRLEVTVRDSDGKKVAGKTWQVDSAGGVRTNRFTFEMKRGDGKPLEARAELEVTGGGKEETAAGTITFTAVKGKGESLKLAEARERARAKLEDAEDAVSTIIALGINAIDLTRLLDEIKEKLDEAETVKECNEVYDTAVAIINDCSARRTAFEEEQKNRQEEEARQQDIENCRQVMLDYARANSAPLANIHLENFTMNDERTHAEADVVGTITAHMDPDYAGQEMRARIVANKEGGLWVVAYYGD